MVTKLKRGTRDVHAVLEFFVQTLLHDIWNRESQMIIQLV